MNDVVQAAVADAVDPGVEEPEGRLSGGEAGAVEE